MSGETILILNRTSRASERYRLITGGMGCYGHPAHYPTHKYKIANGIDRGNGYQGYSSVTYALQDDNMPKEAQRILRNWLQKNGYSQYLEELKAKA